MPEKQTTATKPATVKTELAGVRNDCAGMLLSRSAAIDLQLDVNVHEPARTGMVNR